MNVYNTGYLLEAVPTGFGGNQSIFITNSAHNPVSYNISISNTVFHGTSTDNEDVENTLFLSNSSKYISSDSNDGVGLNKTLFPNENFIFYVLHKPFSDFKKTHAYYTGYESADITIKSTSSCGTNDQNIIINITGERTTGFARPNKLIKFYGTKDYDQTKQYFVNFSWESLQYNNYFTGFKVELSSTTGFSSIVNTNYLSVTQNTDPYLPRYGNYDGFIDRSFSYSETNLPLIGDLYARIQPINPTGDTGYYTYATGFSYYNPQLDDIAYYGSCDKPGYNFKFSPEMLYLTYNSDYELDFDLFDYVYKQNNNSIDLTKYSGINIKFNKATDLKKLGIFTSSSTQNGCINFIAKTKNNQNIDFNTGENGIFKFELEFENIGLYGCNGNGTTFNSDGSYSNPTIGGPIFNLDNIQITDLNNNIKTIEYHIYKDSDSIFYAGAAGGQGYIITDANESSFSVQQKIDGPKFNNLDLINLVNSASIP